MHRTLQPELLDSLPPNHPDALHNRRDLRLTNFVVGNYRWFARRLPRLMRPGERVLEVGAGTGELGERLAREGVPVDGLDLWPRPAHWPAASAWHVGDLRTFEDYDRYPVVIGNLIFHQFSNADLANLGRKLRAHARVFVAVEPARHRQSQTLFRVFAPLFGANYVSLHDAHVSIAAGFVGRELIDVFGFDASTWDVSCRISLLGMMRLTAVRRPTRPT